MTTSANDSKSVIPAQAGIHSGVSDMDPGLRRGDDSPFRHAVVGRHPYCVNSGDDDRWLSGDDGWVCVEISAISLEGSVG